MLHDYILSWERMKIRDFKFGTIQVGHGKSYPTDDIKPFLKWGVVNHVIDSFFWIWPHIWNG